MEGSGCWPAAGDAVRTAPNSRTAPPETIAVATWPTRPRLAWMDYESGRMDLDSFTTRPPAWFEKLTSKRQGSISTGNATGLKVFFFRNCSPEYPGYAGGSDDVLVSLGRHGVTGMHFGCSSRKMIVAGAGRDASLLPARCWPAAGELPVREGRSDQILRSGLKWVECRIGANFRPFLPSSPGSNPSPWPYTTILENRKEKNPQLLLFFNNLL